MIDKAPALRIGGRGGMPRLGAHTLGEGDDTPAEPRSHAGERKEGLEVRDGVELRLRSVFLVMV